MTPGDRPALELDVDTEVVLDLDDAGIEEGEVGGGTGRAILEVEPDLESLPRPVHPDLVVHPLDTVIDLEEHDVGVVVKIGQLRR